MVESNEDPDDFKRRKKVKKNSNKKGKAHIILLSNSLLFNIMQG